MPNIFNADNGAVSGSAGIKLSSDTSGVLNIQTNGTTAISISSSQVVSFPSTTSIGTLYFAAGTAAAPSISVTGDTNTGIYFPGADQVAVSAGGVQRLLVDSVGTTLSTGVLTVPAGTVSAPSITTTGDSNTGIYFPAADTIAFTEGGVESMRIDSSGNLGIGTSSPGYKLDVRGVTASGNGTITTGFSWDTRGLVGTFSNHGLGFLTNGSVRANLDTAGNLGLGVTPSAWGQGRAFEVLEQGYGVWNGTGSAYLLANTYFNSGFKYANTGAAASHYYQFQGAHVWSTAPSGTAGNAITFTQAMTLNASGNLGLGTTNPTQLLHLVSDSAQLRVSNTAATIFSYMLRDGFYSSGANQNLYTLTSHPIVFWTNGSERVRIGSDGAFLVRTTTNPTGAWNGNSIANINGGLQLTHPAGTGRWRQLSWSGDGSDGNLYFPGGTSLSTVANVAWLDGTGVWVNASDARQKTNIREIHHGLASVLQTQPRAYNRNDTEDNFVGFVAQELKQVIPEVVRGSDKTSYGVDYGSLVAVAFKAIQELKAELDQLKGAQ